MRSFVSTSRTCALESCAYLSLINETFLFVICIVPYFSSIKRVQCSYLCTVHYGRVANALTAYPTSPVSLRDLL